MANDDESREMMVNGDVLAVRDDFAQLAAGVFEWHLARTRAVPAARERAASGVVWMSRNTPRADVAPADVTRSPAHPADGRSHPHVLIYAS